MTDTLGTGDRGKRVVTTDGSVLGRVASVDGDAVYVRPRRGLLGGTDSWIAPSWDEREPLRLDERAVVGVGDTAVVVEPADGWSDRVQSDGGAGRPDARGNENG